MAAVKLVLKPGEMTLADLRRVLAQPVSLILHDSCHARIEASVRTVEDVIKKGATVYGVNTGFGKLARERIDAEKLEKLQENLVLSHATGTGPLLDDAIVRLMMVLKINALAQGYSGIRRTVIDALIALVNHDIYPCVPAQGSVGASGDLAPLAHMSMALLGQGEVRYNGNIIPARQGLEIAGLKPMTLGPKEGLALLNGTQLSAALALAALFAAEHVFAAAVVAGALSLEAARGLAAPFDARIHDVRRQDGQKNIAAQYRRLIAGSAISDAARDGSKVQDPYCLRCIPQVMGACLDHIGFVAGILEREANAVTDNPLVFAEDGSILSGGNFHAEPVAMAADTLALAIAETGNMAERRIAMLIDQGMSGLPPFLVKDAGLNSGFMIAHVTAAALASENKQLSHPASVDSIPTSAGQEDHVSMAPHGARRLLAMAENSAAIVAIELLAAVQGVDFHRPLKTSAALEDVHAKIRASVPFYSEDRYFAPDIAAVKAMVTGGAFTAMVGDLFSPGKAG